MVLFDLPGTMGSDGVIATISALDYLFVPIKADRLVLESTLNFATTVN
ncbi:ParA family protein, partial [Phocaeicola vulgatus]